MQYSSAKLKTSMTSLTNQLLEPPFDVARMVEARGVNRVLVGKPEGKRIIGETKTLMGR